MVRARFLAALLLGAVVAASASCGAVTWSSSTSTTVGKHSVSVKITSGASSGAAMSVEQKGDWAKIIHGPVTVEIDGSTLIVNGQEYDIPNEDDAIDIEDSTVRIGGEVASPRTPSLP